MSVVCFQYAIEVEEAESDAMQLILEDEQAEEGRHQVTYYPLKPMGI